MQAQMDANNDEWYKWDDDGYGPPVAARHYRAGTRRRCSSEILVQKVRVREKPWR